MALSVVGRRRHNFLARTSDGAADSRAFGSTEKSFPCVTQRRPCRLSARGIRLRRCYDRYSRLVAVLLFSNNDNWNPALISSMSIVSRTLMVVLVAYRLCNKYRCRGDHSLDQAQFELNIDSNSRSTDKSRLRHGRSADVSRIRHGMSTGRSDRARICNSTLLTE